MQATCAKLRLYTNSHMDGISCSLSQSASKLPEQGVSQTFEEAPLEEYTNAKCDHIADYHTGIYDSQRPCIPSCATIETLGHV